jgi:hypothetical protein
VIWRRVSVANSANYLAFAAFCAASITAADPPDKVVVFTPANEQVRILNLSSDSANVDALKMAASQVIALWQQDKLIRTKVKIFADHPIVKDAMAEKTIEIISTATTPQTTLLIPLSHGGNRVIVKRGAGPNETYSLYSLPPDAVVDLNLCLKK